MSLSDTINAAIKEAMLAKEKDKLAALRAVKSELLLLETSKPTNSSEEEVLKVLQKMVKQRRESANIYKEQGREDLSQDELFQAEVIASYLPQQLTEEEIKVEIQKIINETGASSPADMGKIMGIATKKLTGKADGKTIAAVTKTLLN